MNWERRSPTWWRRHGWEASHRGRWTGTGREVRVCRKRNKAQHEAGGPEPGAENDRKSQESLWCQVFQNPFPAPPLSPLSVYPEILSLGHHIYLGGLSRPEKVR